MEIIRRTVKRSITEAEMIRLKSIEPFSTFRQDSKACFPGDTKIILEGRGETLLKDIVPEVNKGYFTPNGDNTLKVYTPNNTYDTILFTFFNETIEWIEIETENGDIVKVTPNHECLILRKGRKQKVKASDIVESDKLLVYTK